MRSSDVTSSYTGTIWLVALVNEVKYFISLNDVLCTPSITHNLTSISQAKKCRFLLRIVEASVERFNERNNELVP